MERGLTTRVKTPSSVGLGHENARDRPRPARQMLSETENSPKVFTSNYGSIDNDDILVYLGELPFKLMDQIRWQKQSERAERSSIPTNYRCLR